MFVVFQHLYEELICENEGKNVDFFGLVKISLLKDLTSIHDES